MNGTKAHELKTVQPYFNQLLSGEKTFELRFNDRDFQVGDTLILKEYTITDHDFYGGDEYSGRSITVKVTNVLSGFRGLENSYCILSFASLQTAGLEAKIIEYEKWQKLDTDKIIALEEERDRYKKALEEISEPMRSEYEAACADADWYNNNMPGVGQSLDYKSRPAKPKALEIIDIALNK